jgi:hypothetical protein
MVIDLKRHGLDGGRSQRLGASALDSLADYIKSGIGEIASDKGVKARVVSEAIKSVTGVAPVVDTSDPNITWVRTVPAHGDFIDAIFMASAKKITAGPSKGKDADFKIDVAPALQKVVLLRFLPAALLVGAGLFAAGYYMGKD